MMQAMVAPTKALGWPIQIATVDATLEKNFFMRPKRARNELVPLLFVLLGLEAMAQALGGGLAGGIPRQAKRFGNRRAEQRIPERVQD